MTARINTVIGRYWGGMARVLDIIYLLAAFGALGGLPPLLDVVAKYARHAMTSLRASHTSLRASHLATGASHLATGASHLATGALTHAGSDITVHSLRPAAASRPCRPS
jgi:X-X-X-Leu-X-X-Gly heptad repeat protein